MSREILHDLWTRWWDHDIWITPWSKAIAGLTPEQAAWKPQRDRHSIWQNVTHVIFWREYTLSVVAGRPKPSSTEVDVGNFAEPPRSDAASWRDTSSRLKDSHDRIAAALADPRTNLERIKHHLAHDAYHLGQIMHLRALQGLTPVV